MRVRVCGGVLNLKSESLSEPVPVCPSSCTRATTRYTTLSLFLGNETQELSLESGGNVKFGEYRKSRGCLTGETPLYTAIRDVIICPAGKIDPAASGLGEAQQHNRAVPNLFFPRMYV